MAPTNRSAGSSLPDMPLHLPLIIIRTERVPVETDEDGYIRRTRVIDGSPYYIYPEIVGGRGVEKEHEGVMELATQRGAGGGPIWVPTMIWRATNGHIIKTFHRL